jgi:hypothetical protein
MDMLELKNLNQYNIHKLTRNEIARAAGLSWPTANRYLNEGAPLPTQPSMVHVALLLDGMGIDWRKITLGDLLGDSGS